ncbi:MAG: acyl-[acyl-carrier-protein]--UDP-N-acetylglucosamine O-acyltransferase [Proteobacteria bacterium SW_6_67_9]|nr:MAG: acyl-[acyl-carrier-protein]--UDP-N-acetylglucosamine O-acyltransferase [Proteobacteria bacterium SW_6_67_9]
MIHENALVDPSAQVAADAEIGPFCVIGPDVEIGSGTTVASHTVIRGPTRIGRDNRIFAFASVGEAPQDLKYAGEPTELIIGDRNTLREYVTLNRGTSEGGGVTRVGDDNLLMAYIHIAHDCSVGNSTVFANAASLGGHVEVGDWAILGGFSCFHQFTRIGAHSFTGMASSVSGDVAPFMRVAGNRARGYGVNKNGLERRGFDADAIKALQSTYKLLLRGGKPRVDARQRAEALALEHEEVRQLLAFIDTSERGVVR